MVRHVLPDPYPVDEHIRRIGTRPGIAATRTSNRKIQDRKYLVAGVVERPILEGVRRNIEVWLRAVNVVLPKADTGLIPLASPRVPPAVNRDLGSRPFGAVWFCVDGGCRRPVAVAVPFEHVDFAAANRIVITQPPGGPATCSKAVEFYSGFPGVADASPPRALNFAAVVGAAVFCGPDDEIGLAVEEHVSAIVAVLPDVLGSFPKRRVLHWLPGSRHRPLRRIGG